MHSFRHILASQDRYASRTINRWHCTLAIGLAPVTLSLMAAPAPCRQHDVLTETVMPHLEENLRHANTREKRCLASGELETQADAFPVLKHPSLRSCRLDKVDSTGDTVSYTLLCGGGSGTTGIARWTNSNGKIRGTLEVKLGGKNMTFSQRVTATPLNDGSNEADKE